jgi:hypothetical protein
VDLGFFSWWGHFSVVLFGHACGQRGEWPGSFWLAGHKIFIYVRDSIIAPAKVIQMGATRGGSPILVGRREASLRGCGG